MGCYWWCFGLGGLLLVGAFGGFGWFVVERKRGY